MSIWRVRGGAPLEGSLTIQGACVAALPVLAACVLAGSETELTNVPALRDVETALDILARLRLRGLGRVRRVPDELLRDRGGPVRYRRGPVRVGGGAHQEDQSKGAQ